MPPKKVSSYSKMYLVTPSVYDKLLKCLDEGDKKITKNLNKPTVTDQPLRPSEQLLQNLTNSDITSEAYQTANEPLIDARRRNMDNFLNEDLPDDIFDDEVNEWRESTPIPTGLRPSSPVLLNWSGPAEDDTIMPRYINPLRNYPPPPPRFRPNPVSSPFNLKKKPDSEPVVVSTHVGPAPPPPPPPGIMIPDQPRPIKSQKRDFQKIYSQ